MTDTERAKSFKRTLASVRYQATHYSPIGHKLLRGALKRIGDQDGELLVGEKFKDFRAEFAADVDAQIFFPMKGDEEPFRHLLLVAALFAAFTLTTKGTRPDRQTAGSSGGRAAECPKGPRPGTCALGYGSVVAIAEPLLEQTYGLVPHESAVLDIGCNDGGLLARIRAARPDLKLAGIDLDPEAVEQARLTVPDADLRVGSVAELPFPEDAAFDLVTCMDVIEHLPEPIRAPMFREVRRVLKPGGRFILQTPHAGTFEVLDAQNLRHRFPSLYRRFLRRGLRDRAYAGQQDVVWHKHFTLGELLAIAGPDWNVERARYPGLLLWPLADLILWPFHRSGRTDHRVAEWLRRAIDWDGSRDYGPKRGYEILLTLSRP